MVRLHSTVYRQYSHTARVSIATSLKAPISGHVILVIPHWTERGRSSGRPWWPSACWSGSRCTRSSTDRCNLVKKSHPTQLWPQCLAAWSWNEPSRACWDISPHLPPPCSALASCRTCSRPWVWWDQEPVSHNWGSIFCENDHQGSSSIDHQYFSCMDSCQVSTMMYLRSMFSH